MRSMTGFGSATGSSARHRFEVTARSVNGRHLDLSLRLDEPCRDLEPELRRLLESEVRRGRVDVGVEVRSLGPPAAEVEVQTEVVRALHAACHELVEKGLVTRELALGDLLRMPDVITVRVERDGLDEEERRLLLDTVASAVAQLAAARAQEGAQLERLLASRLAELATVVEVLRDRSAAVRQGQLDSLRQRLRELAVEVDEQRLAQEAALLVERSDVAEEIDRLGAHVEHFAEIVRGDGAVGKRLDFLTQEVLRELNTVGAKARDAVMTRAVLDGKVLCEQLREQVQNVE